MNFDWSGGIGEAKGYFAATYGGLFEDISTICIRNSKCWIGGVYLIFAISPGLLHM